MSTSSTIGVRGSPATTGLSRPSEHLSQSPFGGARAAFDVPAPQLPHPRRATISAGCPEGWTTLGFIELSTPAPRWYVHHFRLTSPEELDDEVLGWLKRGVQDGRPAAPGIVGA